MANFNQVKIAPSTDPCENEEVLISYVRRLNNVADFIHCDVMNKNFVNRDTINDQTVANIYARTLLPLDVHLMVNEPYGEVKKYIKAGAQIVTVHYEAFHNKRMLIKTLKYIRKNKALAGISINPDTDVMEIMPYLSYADLVLVMSVYPGYSGQKFIHSTNLKVRKLKQIREDYGAKYLIEVDGGITPEVSRQLRVNGADILVSGSYVYKAESYAQAIEDLK